ncbi:helix-turn-helix domain-containing protein [Clostridium sp. SYSU_GA19001]|uniref:GH39 family glycosyl hydrolase n=1 Tax=Clostridium caldaquaticum TaxID=2940653 RepID=UPI0020776B3A|nr:helix-turn-helix domain-containing protein [Clostridium caldaquaticum]MCM8709958.1 helix-turn-helix domain-containing protein [Clostridium caldaquaticum]
MEERHEIINFSDKIPVKIFINKLGNVPKHWHNSLEILFILSGTVHILVDDKYYSLNNEDLLLINSQSLHELYSDECELITLQINLSKSEFFNDYKNLFFSCCSIDDTDKNNYDYIRYLLAKLIKVNESGENSFLTIAITCLLLNELVTNFQAKKPDKFTEDKKNFNQLSNILDYINNHYREGITLNDIAKNEHFSVSYLSRFFKKYMGVNFTSYYNKIRLEHAVNEMLSSDEPISAIAINNGFPDSRAFVSLFKESYGMLPSEYRSKNTANHYFASGKNEINYLAVTTSSSLTNLAKYLNMFPEHNVNLLQRKLDKQIDIGTIDINKCKKILAHKFRKLCCVGSTRDLLFSEVQDMLKQLQREMPFEYIKFHGLLSDDMMIYDELSDGTPILSFTYIDKVLDFLLSVGLKPLIQLSFMPKALASDKEKNSFFMQYNTSPPKDINKWVYLVTSLTNHLIDRYSLKEVLKWPFCVWNEPDTPPEMFGFKDTTSFYNFYKATYFAVKQIDKRIIFGSPSLLLLPEDPFNWYYSFFEYCYKNKCLPDFLNIHYYDDNFEILTKNPINNIILNRLNTDEDSFSKYLDSLFNRLELYHLKDIPVYMTEWNLTVNHRNLINDTCFKACYITKNLLENYDRLNSFGYWSLTDFINELQPSEMLFHGGLGLFTINGIPKAHYHAFKLLYKLENELIDSGKGWFITKSSEGDTIQILLYNYTHYSNLFATGEIFDMTSIKRYTSFSNLCNSIFSVRLSNITYESCIIKETFINRNNGSSFDSWVQMGGQPLTSNEELEILKSHSQPGMYIHKENIKSGYLDLQITLEPLEIRLIEIKFKVKQTT